VGDRQYRQGLRAERAEGTRRRILDAIQQRLREAPSQPVSLDEVARDARVARPTIYRVFGSRAGLFDAVAEDMWNQAGFDRLVQAVAHPDAREHLRGALSAGVDIFAALRDVARALFAMTALDQDTVGGAIRRIEENRAGGNAYLARRLAEQRMLRGDVGVEQATDVLWMLSSFECFDLLYTGRQLTVDQTTGILVTTAERTLLEALPVG
jgi:AcrR family transcriptional regulator